jgi:hypothetical protein
VRPAGYWRKYRLGDLARGHRDLWKSVPTSYPGSTGTEYIARRISATPNQTGHIRRYDAATLCGIARERGCVARDRDSVPGPGEFVVHLRMGDVLEHVLPSEIDDLWDHGLSLIPLEIRNMINRHNSLGWWHYVKSKCYFKALLPLIPVTTARVTVVGSVIHGTRDNPQPVNTLAPNTLYRDQVKRFFEEAGYAVTVRHDGSPDDDFVWMSHAEAFAASGGGFSKLIRDCVEVLGGLAVNPGPLDKACLNATSAPIVRRNYSWETRGWHGRGGSWEGTKSYPTP